MENVNCDSCNYCDFCNYCDYCNSCNYCDSCYSCDSCNYCYSFNYCKNLKMTEYNIFCFSENYNDENSFQQKRYRAFNKEVGKKRYYETIDQVRKILGTPEMKLKDFWKQVTTKQWKQLLEIPEAKDFKEGFEYISGQEINLEDEVDVTFEGKTTRISRKSAIALGLIK